jgi:hypothetical protein
MTEEAKAVKEVAKTAGKAIDASREVGGFISKFIAGPLEQGLGIFEDKLKYMRWELQVAFMDKVNKKMAELGLKGPTQPVPMKITIPLLQAASMEDDDNLQELWANLLVNAADKDSGVEVHRNHITILQDLTSFDARILQKAYSAKVEYGVSIGVWALPEELFVMEPSDKTKRKQPKEDVALAIENLCRLRLLQSAVWAAAESIGAVYQTRLGRHLYKACTDRKQ